MVKLMVGVHNGNGEGEGGEKREREGLAFSPQTTKHTRPHTLTPKYFDTHPHQQQ